ncbi:MAG: hypothetical protein AAF078_13195 [Planctomycetota bacterium]
MARSLGELFPVIVVVLGVYFLIAAMTAPSVVTTTYQDAATRVAMATLESESSPLANVDPQVRAAIESANEARPIAANPAPGLYAIASAFCFGSVLLWSRMGVRAGEPAQA